MVDSLGKNLEVRRSEIDSGRSLFHKNTHFLHINSNFGDNVLVNAHRRMPAWTVNQYITSQLHATNCITYTRPSAPQSFRTFADKSRGWGDGKAIGVRLSLAVLGRRCHQLEYLWTQWADSGESNGVQNSINTVI